MKRASLSVHSARYSVLSVGVCRLDQLGASCKNRKSRHMRSLKLSSINIWLQNWTRWVGSDTLFHFSDRIRVWVGDRLPRKLSFTFGSPKPSKQWLKSERIPKGIRSKIHRGTLTQKLSEVYDIIIRNYHTWSIYCTIVLVSYSNWHCYIPSVYSLYR